MLNAYLELDDVSTIEGCKVVVLVLVVFVFDPVGLAAVLFYALSCSLSYFCA